MQWCSIRGAQTSLKSFHLASCSPSFRLLSTATLDSRGVKVPLERKRGPAFTLPLLSTLNPSALVSTDHLDLSHKSTFRPRFAHKETPPMSEETSMVYFRGTHLPFPARTSGFLYFHKPDKAAPLEGSVRFRLTSSSSPASFETGQDLLLPLGVPWQLNLPQIACHGHPRVRSQVLRDNLVTQDQLALCRALFKEKKHIYPYFTLFRLTQEFPVNFGNQICFLAVIGEDKILTIRTSTPFQTSFTGGGSCFPWTGSAIARFEPCTDPRHAGRRVVQLRILRIIQPVSSNLPPGQQKLSTLIKPEEGEFLVRRRYGVVQPWAYDIDTPKDTLFRRGMDLLWGLDH
ncbi:hypothetical protein R3P38DRAFT_2850254 [Favolaschia claudopus]|uniref:Uncharacterized protein n=1 Tax=Favolaschia claudopus TaxID=2862362 RepID=A0AAW0DYJ9_9AGAR